MRITDLLDKRSISLDAVCASKSDALDQAVALMVKSGKINDEEAYRKQDRKSTRLNSSHITRSRMPSSA